MSAPSGHAAGPALTVLSLGAGVQSTTLALLAVAGVLPGPDVAIFADTGWESTDTYAHLDRLEPVLAGAGVPLHRVSAGDLRADAVDPAHRFASIPYFTRRAPGPCRRCGGGRMPAGQLPAGERCTRCRGTGWEDGRGVARRQCTGEYKVKPIKAEVRRLLGHPHPARVPAGVHAEQWIGFSADEVGRHNDHRGWPRCQRPAYPLMDRVPMTRRECEWWLSERGGSVARSACVGCPFHGNRHWRSLRDHRPREWARTVAFDAAIRRGGASATPPASRCPRRPSTASAGANGPPGRATCSAPQPVGPDRGRRPRRLFPVRVPQRERRPTAPEPTATPVKVLNMS